MKKEEWRKLLVALDIEKDGKLPFWENFKEFEVSRNYDMAHYMQFLWYVHELYKTISRTTFESLTEFVNRWYPVDKQDVVVEEDE